jgi:hypothetical protein
VRKVLRIDDDLTQVHSKARAFAYMASHFVVVQLFLLFPILVWRSFELHTAFCVVLFSVACWFGAVKYHKMMTTGYIERMQQLLEAERDGSGGGEINADAKKDD